MSSTPHLTNIIPSNEHIMLLYSSDDERNNAAVNYINNGVKSGYQCIYASINAPHKRIILTATNSLNNIRNMIDSIGIKSQDVIVKPFLFSDLFSILKEPRMSYN
jgi:hypothetical protein